MSETGGDRAPPASAWWRVAAMAVALAVSGGAVANYVLGVLLKDIVHNFGATRGAASSAIALYMIGLGLGVPVSGVLVDRFGARWPAVGAIIAFAAALAGLSLVDSLSGLSAMLALAGFVAGGTMVVPYVVTIAARFDRHRGLALGLGAAGLGLGGLVLPRVVAALVEDGGWRGAVRGVALLIPLVALPGALFALNRRPVASGRRLVTGPDAPWRFRAFWIIALAIALVTIGVGGATIHAAALLTDRGMTLAAATKSLAVMAAAVVVGRIGGGWLMDRLHPPFVAAGFFLLVPLAACFLLAGTPTTGVTALVFLGLAAGSEADAISVLSARYLQLATLGTATGLLQLVFSLANATGVAAFGFLFDRAGSYRPALVVTLLCGVAAAFVVTRLRRHP